MSSKPTRGRKPSQTQRVNRELQGAISEVDGRTLQPIVHISGVIGGWDGETGQGEFANVQLEPRAALVREADGKEWRLRLDNPQPRALLAMLLVAAAVALLLWALGRHR